MKLSEKAICPKYQMVFILVLAGSDVGSGLATISVIKQPFGKCVNYHWSIIPLNIEELLNLDKILNRLDLDLSMFRTSTDCRNPLPEATRTFVSSENRIG